MRSSTSNNLSDIIKGEIEIRRDVNKYYFIAHILPRIALHKIRAETYVPDLPSYNLQKEDL